MGDVCLGVELELAVHPAGNFAGSEGRDDGGDAGKEVVGLLLFLQAGIELGDDFLEPLGEGRAGPIGDLVPHEDADAVYFLPLVLQG